MKQPINVQLGNFISIFGHKMQLPYVNLHSTLDSNMPNI